MIFPHFHSRQQWELGSLFIFHLYSSFLPSQQQHTIFHIFCTDVCYVNGRWRFFLSFFFSVPQTGRRKKIKLNLWSSAVKRRHRAAYCEMYVCLMFLPSLNLLPFFFFVCFISFNSGGVFFFNLMAGHVVHRNLKQY